MFVIALKAQYLERGFGVPELEDQNPAGIVLCVCVCVCVCVCMRACMCCAHVCGRGYASNITASDVIPVIYYTIQM